MSWFKAIITAFGIQVAFIGSSMLANAVFGDPLMEDVWDASIGCVAVLALAFGLRRAKQLPE